MSKIIVSIFLILTFLCSPAMSEIITIKQTVMQTFGGGQSVDDARIYGIAKAKREALEKAGTYIETLTVVKNSQVEKDEILALTAGVLKAEVISQKNYASDDAFGIELIVNVFVDTSVLEERVKKQLQDRTHLKQLKDTQKREKELLQKVSLLEDENRKLSAAKQSTEKLKKEFQKASMRLTAISWFYRAAVLWDGRKFTVPKNAIEYLSNAIKLQPDFAEAFGNRGNAYADLGQFQRAIEDYNKVIHLKQDLAMAYNNRGNVYLKLGEYQRAIEDFNKAIHLKPDYFETYNNRGLACEGLGQRQRAIEDYSKVIHLKPDYAEAYNLRGLAYEGIGQYERAIKDFNQAIRLKPYYADAYFSRGKYYGGQSQYKLAIADYDKAILMKQDDAIAYNNRGRSYNSIGQQQRAIDDFNKAIQLKPDYVRAYSNRGNAYVKLSQYQRAIEDYDKAITLKPYDAEVYALRGVVYFMQGKDSLCCRDLKKACELGNCKAIEMIKIEGVCR